MAGERQERLKALGARLRALRTDAGMTGAVLAERAGVRQSTVSKIETGRMVPSLDVLGRLCAALGLDDATRQEVRELLAVVEEAPAASSEDGLPGLAVERAVRKARLVRSFQCVVLPALLQSAGYAWHAFATGSASDAEAIGRAVAGRVERQSVLYEPGRESVFVLTEGVLRTWPGTPALMLAQLDRLLAVTSMTSVRLGVIPWNVPVPALPPHGFTLCDDRAVVVETLREERVRTEPEELAAYRELFERLEKAAVFGEEARRFLLRVMAEYRELAAR